MPTTSPRIIPTLRYRDARTAIDFLTEAFGFERHLVVDAEDGGVAHAQLTIDGGMIMLGQDQGGELDRYQKAPSEVGGIGTQSPYIVVDDVDVHHDRAKAAGAEVLLPPADQPYGGRLYTCRDPEGHVWSFGSYDPWAE